MIIKEIYAAIDSATTGDEFNRIREIIENSDFTESEKTALMQAAAFQERLLIMKARRAK